MRRYLSQQDGWIQWIDTIVAILQGSQRELCHEFVASPAVPRGQRMENFLAGLEALPSVDDAVILASLALADLADFIGAFFDSSFELVRYGESLATSHKGFQAVEEGLAAPVLQDFYGPIVQQLLQEYGRLEENQRLLLCVSCPFPGTLAAALFTCKKFNEALGNKVFVVLGGGYVNTELRQVREPALAGYLDALSYDRGYGSYWDFFSHLMELEGADTAGGFPSEIKNCSVYKMKFFGGDATLDQGFSVKPEVVAVEDGFTASLAPDYSDIDFSQYPRLGRHR